MAIISADARFAARQQPRRLDDHPAAGPRAAPATGPRPGPEPDGGTQAQGDHPVDPGDEGVSGRGGQADDHHRLPQPELLRQPGLRREGRGRGLFRDPAGRDHARPGRDHRRPSRSRRRTTTSSRNAIDSARSRSTRTAIALPTRRQLDGPRRHGHRPAPERHPRPARRGRSHADAPGTRTAAPTSRPRSSTRSSLASQATPQWIAPHFVWAVRDELTDEAVRARMPRRATPSRQGGLRVTTTLDVPLQKIAEKWVKAAAIVPHAKDPLAEAKKLGFKSLPAWMAQPEEQGRPQRRARRRRLPDRRARGLRRQRELLLELDQQEVPAPVRRRRQGLSPAGLGVQAVQLRHRHRRQDHDGRLDAHGQRDRLRRRLHAERRGQPRARAGPRPHRPPVLAEHPVGQGHAGQLADARVRDGEGLRDDVPDRQDQGRPRPRARRRRRSGRSTS